MGGCADDMIPFYVRSLTCSCMYLDASNSGAAIGIEPRLTILEVQVVRERIPFNSCHSLIVDMDVEYTYITVLLSYPPRNGMPALSYTASINSINLTLSSKLIQGTLISDMSLPSLAAVAFSTNASN